MMRLRKWRMLVRCLSGFIALAVSGQLWLVLVKPIMFLDPADIAKQSVSKKGKTDSSANVKTTRMVPKCEKQAFIPSSARELLQQIEPDVGAGHDVWAWPRARIVNLWPKWHSTVGSMMASGKLKAERQQKNVVVVPGVLLMTDFASQDSIAGGGPLGDLIQWADLTAALYALGHNITLMKQDFWDVARVLRYRLQRNNEADSGSSCDSHSADLVYADIDSVKALPEDIIKEHRCKLRVIDAYGTEAMYNDKTFALKLGYESMYGQLNLNLKQFFTFYPHTPDNSFLGFVVNRAPIIEEKENIGLLYGKNPKYFKNKREYIKLLQSRMEVHATLPYNNTVLPAGVINHGVISPKEYQQLLSKARYFIGVGLPMESVGVMEALAHGCVFLNPRYEGDEQRVLQREGKPTGRKMTSQVPYLEKYVAHPYVYTISVNNESQILNTLDFVSKIKPLPFVPYEFTMEGFLERLDAYIENQDLCDHKHVWPPKTEMQPVISQEGTSCNDACESMEMVCEPVYFPFINTELTFSRSSLKCSSRNMVKSSNTYLPAYNMLTGQCVVQTNSMLFSCASTLAHIRRLCPCRRYIHHQMALCYGCF